MRLNTNFLLVRQLLLLILMLAPVNAYTQSVLTFESLPMQSVQVSSGTAYQVISCPNCAWNRYSIIFDSKPAADLRIENVRGFVRLKGRVQGKAQFKANLLPKKSERPIDLTNNGADGFDLELPLFEAGEKSVSVTLTLRIISSELDRRGLHKSYEQVIAIDRPQVDQLVKFPFVKFVGAGASNKILRFKSVIGLSLSASFTGPGALDITLGKLRSCSISEKSALRVCGKRSRSQLLNTQTNNIKNSSVNSARSAAATTTSTTTTTTQAKLEPCGEKPEWDGKACDITQDDAPPGDRLAGCAIYECPNCVAECNEITGKWEKFSYEECIPTLKETMPDGSACITDENQGVHGLCTGGVCHPTHEGCPAILPECSTKCELFRGNPLLTLSEPGTPCKTPSGAGGVCDEEGECQGQGTSCTNNSSQCPDNMTCCRAKSGSWSCQPRVSISQCPRNTECTIYVSPNGCGCVAVSKGAGAGCGQRSGKQECYTNHCNSANECVAGAPTVNDALHDPTCRKLGHGNYCGPDGKCHAGNELGADDQCALISTNDCKGVVSKPSASPSLPPGRIA